MNQSTRAISLVLISAGSILAAHHAFDTLRQGYQDLDAQSDSWASGSPTTRHSGSSYYGGSSYYYGGHSRYYYSSGSGGGGWSSGSSSGSSSAHGTSFGGFGGTAHGSAS